MKLIDFDDKFNRKMAEMIEKHAGERTEDEWENAVAAAYKKFGDTYMAALGKTPRQYFGQMSDGELVETLKEYLLQEVSVPDFLCEEIEGRGVFPELLSLLNETDEELVLYALNLIGSDRRALQRYVAMLSEEEYDEHVKDAIADLLKERADDVTDVVLPLVHTQSSAYALEILSRTKRRDEGVYTALTQSFSEADEADVPLYAGYIAAYGDDRALPLLLKKIDEPEIGFVAFQELKFAIEALGGEYTKDRDFSSDPSYKKIMEAGGGTDIFGAKKK